MILMEEVTQNSAEHLDLHLEAGNNATFIRSAQCLGARRANQLHSLASTNHRAGRTNVADN